MAANSWPRLTLRKANVLLIDCDHRTPPAAPEGYPYIAIPQLREGRINPSGARLITRDQLAEWTRKAKPGANDVVLSRRCNPGETAFVPDGLEFALGQNLVLLRADGTKIFPPFLRWWVRGPQWWQQVGMFLNVGAVFDSLRCADVPKFELPVPPLKEQRAIAHILGTLDDKIELNRQMNATLEAMAQALFKSWFVDFDPVTATSESTANELPESIAHLFPNVLEDSALGKMPAGWTTGSILTVANLLSGGTPSTTRPEYWNGDIPWASAKDVSQAEETFLVRTVRTISERGLLESATQLVPPFASVIVARGATTGRMVVLGREMAMNQTCYALSSSLDTPFTLHCQLRHAMRELVHAAHGSVFDTITTRTLEVSTIVLPPRQVASAFERLVSPLYQRVRAATEESRTLAALRDTLLPKLISGELRVRNAERLIGAML